jgi:hypothetical protein
MRVAVLQQIGKLLPGELVEGHEVAPPNRIVVPGVRR